MNEIENRNKFTYTYIVKVGLLLLAYSRNQYNFWSTFSVLIKYFERYGLLNMSLFIIYILLNQKR